MSKLHSRVEQLEQKNGGPSVVVCMEGDPGAENHRRQGRTVILLSELDARL